MRPRQRRREHAISCSVAQLGAREILLRSLSPEYADGTLIRSMCNTACVSSTSRRSLVACSKWAHIHFSSGYAFVELISARWRSTEMCPCDAACKTVRLVEMFIDLSQAQIRHTREKTCEARFFIASELSGFARFASLR